MRRWFSPALNALAVTPTLPVAFFLARRRRPVTLLGLPSRPLPRCPPALLAAIALARLARAKTLIATFQQTTAGARTAGRPFPPAAFLIMVWACRILERAHGSVAPGSSSPGGDWHPLRGAQLRFSPNSRLYRTGTSAVRLCLWFAFSRLRRGCQVSQPASRVPPVASSVRHIPTDPGSAPPGFAP